MSYTLLAESFPIARKPHRCIWCGETIPAGEKYIDERSVFDGSMQRHRWHLECQEAQQDEASASGELEFSMHENERPTKEPQ